MRAHLDIAIFKYYALLVAMAGITFLAIRALAEASMNVILAKALMKTLLFIARFSIQRDYIFSRHDARHEQ
jgi:hypothetical protein